MRIMNIKKIQITHPLVCLTYKETGQHMIMKRRLIKEDHHRDITQKEVIVQLVSIVIEIIRKLLSKTKNLNKKINMKKV